MHPTELTTKFYAAFQQRDWKTMHSCYHSEVIFYDPVFRHLKGTDVLAMWHMLCLNAKDFELTFSNVTEYENKATCNWQATYTFSKTGRKVKNVIKATFVFKDGLIIDHKDKFDLWRWSSMALGLPGIMMGWSSYLQNKINQNARKSLEKFKPEYGY